MIAFGFGPPWVSLLMLVATGLISFLLFRVTSRAGARNPASRRRTRAQLRAYYYEQRRRAREFAREFDLSDEEIERRIDAELGPEDRDE
ncbi:MAG: hypothetical protein K6T78_14895 [Alicyclobacillus sp.]|nr:hypothetical protein [Alicyclobacillus sp.]